VYFLKVVFKIAFIALLVLAPFHVHADDMDGLSLWLKAEQCITDIDLDGYFEWQDLSPCKNHLKAPDFSAVPTHLEYVANGYGAMSFDGENDYVQTKFSEPYEGDTTLFFILKLQNNGEGQKIFSTSANGNESGSITIYKNKGSNDLLLGSYKSDGLIDSLVLKSNYDAEKFAMITVRVTVDAQKSRIETWFNNKKTQDVIRDRLYANWNSHYGYNVGGVDLGENAACQIAEVMVYQNALSDAKLQELQQYLNNKYFTNVIIENITYSYKDADGNPSEVIAEGGTMDLDVKFVNTLDVDISEVNFICAFYDSENRLIDVKLSEDVTLSSLNSYTFCMKNMLLPQNLDDMRISFYLWQMHSIIPVSQKHSRILRLYH